MMKSAFANVLINKHDKTAAEKKAILKTTFKDVIINETP